jgi:TusA-related sulfurtransferase
MTEECVVHLDVRGLEPPVPMEQALDRIAHMAPRQTLRLLIHRQPYPLYELLDAMGYIHHTEAQVGGDYVVVIEPGPARR